MNVFVWPQFEISEETLLTKSLDEKNQQLYDLLQ